MSLKCFNTPNIALSPVEYLEFVIDKMKTTSSATLSITSKSNHTIACRLKSSSPKDFQFNQENLMIPVGESVKIEILYTYSVNSYTTFHKFLLQTLVVKDGNYIDWKGPGVHEYKLFAKFVDFQYIPKPPEPVVEPQPVKEVERVERCLRIKKLWAGVKEGLERWFKVLAKPRFNCFHMTFMLILGVFIAIFTQVGLKVEN